MRFRNTSGQRIRLESGARMNDTDCCCGGGCGATITFEYTPGFGTNRFQFYGNATLEEGCAVVSWDWNFGDGTGSSSQNPIKSFSGTGPFTVVLTITDSCGNECTDTAVISCSSCGSTPSTISATIGGSLSDSCGDVDAMIGTFVLDTFGSNQWSYADPDACDCSPPTTTQKKFGISVFRTCRTLTATLRAGNTTGADGLIERCNFAQLSYSCVIDDCTGTFTLDLVSSQLFLDALSACGLMTGSPPSTISVTI